MYITRYEMNIYNRWGQLIYETEESQDWDGKDKQGEYVKSGVYIYVMSIYGLNEDVRQVHGSLTVVR